MRLTKKQQEIIDLVIDGNLDEEGKFQSWLDLDQIIEALSYTPSKEALQCSIKFLVRRGLVIRGDKVLRNSRWRTPIIPTAKTMALFRGSQSKDYVVEDDIITYF